MLTDRCVDAYATRQEKLRGALAAAGYETLLVSHETDIEYLTGFVGHDSLLLVLPDSVSIISDPRYDEFLDPWRQKGVCDVVMGMRHRLHETVKSLCGHANLRRLCVQADHVTVAQMNTYTEALEPLRLEQTTGIVSTLRMCKDDVEIDAIQAAIDLHEEALRAALQRITPGMTEIQLSATLDYEMKWRGAFKPSFDAIVGAGPNSSIIHHMSSTEPIADGTLLIDCGAVLNGYCSDLTRTFAIGRHDPKVAEIYAIVLEAQRAAIEACAPGKICAEIDAVARDIITRAGYGEYFGHGLGHGLGKDVHEAPYFNTLQTDIELQPGMVMTVEPGIYLPGVGGVRIEDDVLITRDGHRVLSSFPKDIESMVLEPASVEVGR